MQLSPRYDGPPIIRLDVPVGDPRVPLFRQRRRLADMLATFDGDQWAAATRCDLWSVQDVVCHLVGTNQFWAASIGSGIAGSPTRYLASFDPVATPEQMVDGMRAMTPREVLDRYVETVDAMEQVLAGLDATGTPGWDAVAEAPPGHVSLRAVVLHALWDAWIHERDIALPMGLEPVVEDDEVAGCLLYAATLGPAFFASTGNTRTGQLTVTATHPEVAFVVESGPTVVARRAPDAPADGPCIAGDAVELVEGLSFRAPLEHALDDDDVWLLGGLGEVFDLAPDEFSASGSSSEHGR